MSKQDAASKARINSTGAERRKKWEGSTPTACDMCERELVNEFVDGRVRGITSWAIMCLGCHVADGVGLGQGMGQHYEKSAVDGEWYKVEG
jgi:hypothetical protein